MTNLWNDFTKAMQDMMAKFPVDASAFQNAFKNLLHSARNCRKWRWKLLKSRPKSRPNGQKRPSPSCRALPKPN